MNFIKQKALVALSIFLFMSKFISAQDKPIFTYVKNGDPKKLSAYLDTTKTSINIKNSKGYSPLHVLIENYVQYRTDYIVTDEVKHDYTSKKSNDFWDCMKLLLDKNASTDQLTPEGWNALQYAVLNGKLSAVSQILKKAGGGGIRDKDGNTLIHLSMLINPDEAMPKFNELINYYFTDYGIDRFSINNAGQTPLAFYMSQPRCNWKTPLNNTKTSTSSNQSCVTSATYDMLESYKDFDLKSVLTKDKSGNSAIDYMKTHNSWALSNFQYFVDLATQAHKELEDDRKFIENQKSSYTNNSANSVSSSSSCSKCNIKETFNKKYDYECSFSQYNSSKIVYSKLSTQFYIEVKTDKIIVYGLYHINNCKIIASKFNNEGDLEYEVEDYSFKSIGFTRDLNKVFLIRHDGTVEGYCNY